MAYTKKTSSFNNSSGNYGNDYNGSRLASGQVVLKDLYPTPLYQPESFVFSHNRPKPGYVVFPNFQKSTLQSGDSQAGNGGGNQTFVLARMKYELSPERSHLVDAASGKALLNYSDWGSLEISEIEAQRLAASLIRLLEPRGFTVSDIMATGMRSEQEKEAGEEEEQAGKKKKKNTQQLSPGKEKSAGKMAGGANGGKKVPTAVSKKKKTVAVKKPASQSHREAPPSKKPKGASKKKQADEENADDDDDGRDGDAEEEDCAVALSSSGSSGDEEEEGQQGRDNSAGEV